MDFPIMTKPTIRISRISYVPVGKYWRKLRPFYSSPEATKIWRLNLRDFTEQKAAQHGFKYKYDDKKYEFPSDHDGCDWRYCRRGRRPKWWDYVCHAACHFLVDLNLYVAMKVWPNTPWRIITQRHHSTVWNGDTKNPILFDLNFLALEVTAKEAWKIASRGRFLKPGTPLRPFVFGKGYFKSA